MRIVKGAGLFLLLILFVFSMYLYSKYTESRRRMAEVASVVETQKNAAQVAARVREFSPGHDAPVVRPLADSPSQLNTRDTNNVPPENTPLISIVRELRQKADNGNAYSACRLAMEVQRCALHEKYDVPKMERAIKNIEIAAVDVPSARDTKRLEALQKRFRRNALVCNGFKNDEDISTDKYILQAALLGHSGAMQLVATAPSLELMTGLATMDSLAARQEYSSVFLQTLARNGNESALGELAEQYAGRSWWNQLALRGAPKTDYAEAAVYAIAADIRYGQRRVLDANLSPFSYLTFLSLDKRLSGSELVLARERAERLVKEFPPLGVEPKVQQVATKENYPDADPKVLMCRE